MERIGVACVEVEKEFLSERYKDLKFTGYRVCVDCGVVQALELYLGMWFDLDEKQTKILMYKIENGEFMGRGD